MLQAARPSALPAPPTRTRLATLDDRMRAPLLPPALFVGQVKGQKMASGDPTLDKIRARRLAELQAQYGGGVRINGYRTHWCFIREEIVPLIMSRVYLMYS